MATAEERAQAHWARLQQAVLERPDRTIRWIDRGIGFIASSPFITPEGRGVGMTIAAQDANGPLPTDNPYVFYNPPLGVVTGTTTEQVQVGVHPRTGEPVYETRVTRTIDASEPLQAAKRMVYDAVTLRARQLGWSP